MRGAVRKIQQMRWRVCDTWVRLRAGYIVPGENIKLGVVSIMYLPSATKIYILHKHLCTSKSPTTKYRAYPKHKKN